MKKTNLPKKPLALETQTIKLLRDGELERPTGGLLARSGISCPGSCEMMCTP
jgi:hypothetical protein